MTGLLAMFLTLGVFAWIAGAALAAGLSRRNCQNRPPNQRIRRAMVVVLLPWFLPLGWSASIGTVAAGKRAGWLDNHCRTHGDWHPHLCFEQFPAIQIEPLLAGALLLVPAILMVAAARHAMAALERRNRINALLHLLPARGLLRRIEGAGPMALVARPLRPVLLISNALLDGLTRRERRVVVAHEAAHLRQGDLFKSSFFEALLAIHLPASAARLRASWRQAIEERADDRVARRFGRIATAQTLLKVVRQQRFPASVGLSASGANVAQRVERLLSSDDRPSASAEWGTAFLAALALVSALPIAGAHHAIETLLGAILGS